MQNSGYPFPVPAHVGAQPNPFRGTPQAMPFFNGSFYSSQMLHPSQIQQQQQQQQLQQQLQQAQTQQVAVQQGHQNTSTSSGSSSSQKHHQQHNQQQRHQQRLQSGGGNAASGNSTSFSASKNRTQKPQNQSFPVGPQVRQHEADVSVEESPSTEESCVSQAHKNAYNHNFAMPIHQKNFASMSSAALTGSGSGNHSERQQHQQQQNINSLPLPSPASSSVQPPGFLLSQPRPKRCATHYYVARNIYYHQHFTKMNPFWPVAAGPASLYGKQPYSLNVLPPTETAMIGPSDISLHMH